LALFSVPHPALPTPRLFRTTFPGSACCKGPYHARPIFLPLFLCHFSTNVFPAYVTFPRHCFFPPLCTSYYVGLELYAFVPLFGPPISLSLFPPLSIFCSLPYLLECLPSCLPFLETLCRSGNVCYQEFPPPDPKVSNVSCLCNAMRVVPVGHISVIH